MENPQIENGMTSIANEIVEVLAKIQLNGYESRFLWALWRKTYGWHKKEDWISNSQIVEMTGLKKSHVSRTEKRLIERHIVTKNGNKMSFNKSYGSWIELPKMVTVTKNGNKVTKNGNKVTKNGNKVTKNGNKVTKNGNGVTNSGNRVTKLGTHKVNYTKETITKEIIHKNVLSKALTFGNTNINECQQYFLEVMKLPIEDGSAKWNRIYWSNMIKEGGRGVVGVKGLIDLASQDEWFKNNITSARDLWRHRVKLIARKRGDTPRVAVMPKEGI